MKKKILSLILASSALLFASCGGSDALPEFEYGEECIINTENDKVYYPTPIGFEPCGVGEKCATLSEGAFDLFEVVGINNEKISSEEWMSEGYAGDASVVFRGEDVSLPDFRDIDFEVCYVCEEDVNVVSIATVTEKDIIDTLIATADSENQTERPDEVNENFSLKFYSSEYPAVFYSLNYYICDDGCYVFNRGENTCVNVGNLLSDYVLPN